MSQPTYPVPMGNWAWSTDQRNAFCQRLREAREARKLTQPQVGEIFGVEKGTVSAWETGKNLIPVDRLSRLCQEYAETADWLILGVRPPPVSAYSATVAETADLMEKLTPSQRRQLYAMAQVMLSDAEGETA